MSSSLGGVSRRPGLAVCACCKGLPPPPRHQRPPAMGGRGCPPALQLGKLCFQLSARGFGLKPRRAFNIFQRKTFSFAQHARWGASGALGKPRPAELPGMGTASRPIRALGARPSDRGFFGRTARPARASQEACRPLSLSARCRDHPRPIPLQLGLAMAQQRAPIGRRHGLLHPPSLFCGSPPPRYSPDAADQ